MSDAPSPNTTEVESDAFEVELDTLEVEIDLSDIVSEVATRYESACALPTQRDEPARPQQQDELPSPPPFEPAPFEVATLLEEAAALQETETPQPEAAPPPAATQPAQPPAQPTQPPAQTVQPPAQSAQSGATHALPPPFGEMVAHVEDVRLRSLVANTFARILKLLLALRAVEDALTTQRVVTVGALFGVVRAQATSLLAHLTETVVRDEGLDEEFREVLDGIRFVVAHEMGKVFSYEFPGLTSEGPSKFTRAELTRAWGLLHNCLQQTAITLARTIDPETAGHQLFEDYRAKTENSLTLYRELQVLLQKVKTAEKSNGILLKHSLVRHLEHFREETMHFLMYKDWGEFGRFVDEVKRAFEEMEDFDNVLHGFAQYLSTLIHHVGMREVLHMRQGQAPQQAAQHPAAPAAPHTRRA